MPELHEVGYSREATIAAFRDYYQFLTTMFLPEDRVKEPPAGGWPVITKENTHLLGKNDEVFELIRHLPYVPEETLLAPYARVGDWPFMLGLRRSNQRPFDESDVEGTKIITEGLDWEDIPSSAFGITRGDVRFILDTGFGVVHWLETPREIQKGVAREPIIADFDDCTPENEHEWRYGTAWAIPDFFKVLKNQYRDLKYIPLHEHRIEEYPKEFEEGDGPLGGGPFMRAVRQVYRDHGWPDLSVYNKQECMDTLHKMIKDRFPEEDL
ncbi:hypothetical protein KCU83_g1505, partial [Aureobasidium melanogenum]